MWQIHQTWTVGIDIKGGDKKLCVLNVYLAYECKENEIEFMDRLGKLHAILEDLNTTCATVVGDFNSYATNSESAFGNYLKQYCSLHKYTWSSQQNAA